MTEPESVNEEMNSFISEYLDVDTDIIPSVAAAGIVDTLRKQFPELLAMWLDHNAEAIVRESVTHVIRSRRSRARTHAVAGVFARQAKEFSETKAPSALTMFDIRHVVSIDDVQRYVRDMTAADCLFVAERYTVSGNRALMEAAFHRAVARRVGAGTVKDHFTEAEYESMYRSIVKAPTAATA